jgi:hypothetical protein
MDSHFIIHFIYLFINEIYLDLKNLKKAQDIQANNKTEQ